MWAIRQESDFLKMKNRLFNRFVLLAITSILLTAVFSTIAFWFVFANQQETDLQVYAETAVRAYNIDSNAAVSDKYSSENIRVTLIAKDGTVIYESADGVAVGSMENHGNRPEFKQAMKTGKGSSKRMSDTLNSITYYYAQKTNDGNVLRVAKTFASVFAMFIGIFPFILIIVIFVLLICIILSRHSSKKIIDPIEKMSANLKYTPYEELYPLAHTITTQQEEIKKQVAKLRLEKDKISTLIQNMSEGFILIDMDRKVLMSNNSATKLIGCGGGYVSGESLIMYSRNEVVRECVDKSLTGESANANININGRILQIMTNPVYSEQKQNGVICLVFDVSSKKKAEKMRREFTANVTHELKTPLTSISGYAEIIASGLARPDDIAGFAGKIHKESGRLLSLIGDIIELSQLDEDTSQEEFAKLDIAGVAYEVAEDLGSNAAKHTVKISVNASQTIINGNRNQIYELIYNLCDNAIRYNKPNGKVTINVFLDAENNPTIRVCDTGIGIPQKHQKRVFERFYRVDKSRSKETGGTGLGLAIVKHIAEHHGGEVTLDSTDNGTTFTVKFQQS